MRPGGHTKRLAAHVASLGTHKVRDQIVNILYVHSILVAVKKVVYSVDYMNLYIEKVNWKNDFICESAILFSVSRFFLQGTPF